MVTRSDSREEPLGYVHKKELFKELLKGQQPDIESLVRAPINLPDSSSVLSALEQMRQGSTHVAFVVNEFGGFEGLLTLTDILEAIAGELPDASEVDGPDVEEVDDGYRFRDRRVRHLHGRQGDQPPQARRGGGAFRAAGTEHPGSAADGNSRPAEDPAAQRVTGKRRT